MRYTCPHTISLSDTNMHLHRKAHACPHTKGKTCINTCTHTWMEWHCFPFPFAKWDNGEISLPCVKKHDSLTVSQYINPSILSLSLPFPPSPPASLVYLHCKLITPRNHLFSMRGVVCVCVVVRFCVFMNVIMCVLSGSKSGRKFVDCLGTTHVQILSYWLCYQTSLLFLSAEIYNNIKILHMVSVKNLFNTWENTLLYLLILIAASNLLFVGDSSK